MRVNFIDAGMATIQTALRMVGLILLLGSNCSALAQEQSASLELKRSGEWMAHYYEHQDSDALPKWIKEISANGGLNKPTARFPVLVFVSELARQHKEKVDAWCAALSDLPVEHRVAISWSFKNSGATNLDRCTKGFPDETLAKLADAKPYSPLNKPASKPGDLDVLWAVFMATGDESPVNMIIDVLARPLPGKGMPGSVEALLMNGAAKWSLALNARQHPRVKSIVTQRASSAEGLLRQGLDEVLGKRN